MITIIILQCMCTESKKLKVTVQIMNTFGTLFAYFNRTSLSSSGCDNSGCSLFEIFKSFSTLLCSKDYFENFPYKNIFFEELKCASSKQAKLSSEHLSVPLVDAFEFF